MFLFQEVHNHSLGRSSGIDEIVNVGWTERIDIKGRSLRIGG